MMTRKQFLGSLAGLFGLAAFAGCKKQEEEGEEAMPDAPMQQVPVDAAVPKLDAPNMMACTTAQSMIAANHGHVLTVSAADLAAAVDKTYDIKGASPHPHTVTITAAMFAMLKSARTLTVVSSNDAQHTHMVTITC